MKRLSMTVLVLCGAGTLAAAQPGPPDDPPADPGPPLAPPSEPGESPRRETPPPPRAADVDQGVIDDATSPGAFLFPTALVEPQATASVTVGLGADTGFNDRELTNVSVAFAVTDRLSIGVSVLAPTDSGRFGLASAKAQVLRQGRVRLAMYGDLLLSGNDAAGLLGGVGSYCLDPACNSLVSATVGAGVANTDAIPIFVSGSAVVEVAPHIKLVGELSTGFATSNVAGLGDLFLGFAGLRLTHKNIGANLGVARPFGSDLSDAPNLLVATLTGRIL